MLLSVRIHVLTLMQKHGARVALVQVRRFVWLQSAVGSVSGVTNVSASSFSHSCHLLLFLQPIVHSITLRFRYPAPLFLL